MRSGPLDHDLDFGRGVSAAPSLHIDPCARDVPPRPLTLGQLARCTRNATTARDDEADDVVTRHGVAAMSQTDQQAAVALALDDNAVTGALAALLRLAVGAASGLLHDLGDSLGLGELFLGLGVQDLLDLIAHSARGNLAGADGGQVLELLEVKLLRHGVGARVERGVEMP